MSPENSNQSSSECDAGNPGRDVSIMKLKLIEYLMCFIMWKKKTYFYDFIIILLVWEGCRKLSNKCNDHCNYRERQKVL